MNDIPKGRTKEDIKAREKLIKDFYAQWISEHPDKKVVFLAVGFETTAPTAAAAVLTAERENVGNFFLLPAQKLVPPAIRALLDDEDARIDGFLLPGHVAVVTGSENFSFLPEEYHLPGVVAGFSPTARRLSPTLVFLKTYATMSAIIIAV